MIAFRSKPETRKAIMEIDFENGFQIIVFPGSDFMHQNDIVIKFRDVKQKRTRERQPSHVHWVVDLLIKREKEKSSVDSFLSRILGRWNGITPLPDRSFDTINANLVLSKDTAFIRSFDSLNQYGFFKIDFLVHLMELLMMTEKTNRPDAYMFKSVVNEIMKSTDLYSILSKAGLKKRS